MSAQLVGSGVFPFADGTAGHPVDLGSAPAVGDVDLIAVLSVTILDSVTGMGAALRSHVDQDAVQTFARTAAGGEGSTITVDTAGNFNTAVIWQRWRGLSSVDGSALGVHDGVAANSTPAASTGPLTGASNLVAALALYSVTGTANQGAGSWAGGYTVDQAVNYSSSTFGLYVASAWKTVAAGAGESPVFTAGGDAPNCQHLALFWATVAPEPPASTGQDDIAMHRRRRR